MKRAERRMPQSIRLEQDDIADKQQLVKVLEKYYLSEGHYLLGFPKARLHDIEFAFDQLVNRYGILKSNFDYEFEDS